MKYKAVLFDMDGVIVDSEPVHFLAFETVLGNRGKHLTRDEYKEYFAGRSDAEGFRRYFNFLDETVDLPLIMNEKTKIYAQLATNRLVAYPGVVELIRELSRTRALALVTGSLRIETEIALQALNIKSCFKVIISADDVEHDKPDPEGYLRAYNKLGIDKNQCIIVEDTPNGLKAAKSAGIKSIAVLNTHSKEELSAADVVVERLQLEMF